MSRRSGPSHSKGRQKVGGILYRNFGRRDRRCTFFNFFFVNAAIGGTADCHCQWHSSMHLLTVDVPCVSRVPVVLLSLLYDSRRRSWSQLEWVEEPAARVREFERRRKEDRVKELRRRGGTRPIFCCCCLFFACTSDENESVRIRFLR